MILRSHSSLRGIADVRNISKDLANDRFHRSVRAWKVKHHPAPPFTENDGLLLIIGDGIWFRLSGERYTCYIILLRPICSSRARLRGLILLPGDESEENWMKAFQSSLTAREFSQIRGIVADGGHGLTTISHKQGWKYQRCHFHLLKDLSAIQGKRPGSTRHLRQRALLLCRHVLNTPSEQESNGHIQKLRYLIAHSDCPRTVRKKVGGFLKHYHKFRTCYRYPELNLPKTSNSAETIARFVQDRMSLMRGIKSPKSLEYWLDIQLRQHPYVKCSSDDTNQIKPS